MKLHSDSVIDKLEDKEKECDALEKQIRVINQKLQDTENFWKIECKAKEEESKALKRALEKKIEKVMNLE